MALGLLARRVPNLQPDIYLVHTDHEGAELHADGDLVLHLKFLAHHVRKQATLAHS